METAQLFQLMEHPETMNMNTLQELAQLVKQYPYFQSARMLYLKNLSQIRSMYFTDELHKNAIYFPDRRLLFTRLDLGEAPWSQLLHQREQLSQTADSEEKRDSFSLIDSFLQDNSEEAYPEQLEDLLPKQAATGGDYMHVLLEKPDVSSTESEVPIAPEKDAQLAIIDSFIAKEEKEGVSISLSEPTEEPAKNRADTDSLIKEDSFLTESLAKIYIKQKKYSKALEIIKKLSLKYPEKNVYFADQIRFLEKIITNIKTE